MNDRPNEEVEEETLDPLTMEFIKFVATAKARPGSEEQILLDQLIADARAQFGTVPDYSDVSAMQAMFMDAFLEWRSTPINPREEIEEEEER